MSHLTHGLALSLHHAARLLARRFEAATRDEALTSAQWRLLVLLKNGEVRQARLAEALEIEPISVSRMIDRMSEAGWVERLPDPGDRRARLVRATPRARASLAGFAEAADAVYAEALAGMSEAEIGELRRLLGQLTRNLSGAAEAEADPLPTVKGDPA